ncbi:MAG: cytochrome c biogenesis protein CcsA [Bacteroidales bacterium]|nr:cytochrome c biogenesis protein CcsA [Bacteroidales bacterium]
MAATVLAVATVVEKLSPGTSLYGQWWFALLLALVGLGALLSLFMGRMWKRADLLLIHLSVPVILLGGGLTTWTAQRGQMSLAPGVPCSEFTADDGKVWSLPFSVELKSFEVLAYEGTRTPMDFVSRVVVEGTEHEVSMNHILRHRGYRFYQSGYDAGGTSTLTVNHDPWGIPVAYCGMAMLLAGLLLAIVGSKSPYRRLLRDTAVAAILALPLAANATAPTLPRATAEQMGRVMVMYKGRLCPLQTLAKDFTTKITGKATYHGLTSEQVLAGYLFFYQDWVDEPAVKVKGSGVWSIDGREVSVPRHASVSQLAFLKGVSQSAAMGKNVRAATEKTALVQGLLSGKMLKMFPVADDGEIGWYGQHDVLPTGIPDDEYIFVRRSLGYCQELVVLGDWDELERVFKKVCEYQSARVPLLTDGAFSRRTRAERLYNSLTTGRWLAMASITLGLVVFAMSLFAQSRRRRLPRWVGVACTVWLALVTIYLAVIFVLRWIVGGHVPMAGGFDSMNLMSLGIGVLALALSKRSGMAVPTGMLALGFCQLVAMMSGSNPPVTNLMPVLNSPLLTAHVAVVMASYALFFFVMLFSVAGLAARGGDYRRTVSLLLYPAVFLLALGIAIGAVWANVSWGNYWSWDPKEVWALITLIIYAVPLHSGVLRRDRSFFIYCALAFFSVAITYFGVNMVLGGLHAYN